MNALVGLPWHRCNFYIAAMAIWRPALDPDSSNRATAIADAIAADVASGRLAVGDRLPPQRILAWALGLSPNTVMRAYDEARRRGLVAGEVGRGTYVRVPAPALPRGGLTPLSRSEDGPVDFSRNLPFTGAAAEELAATLTELGKEPGLADFLDRGEERVRAPQLAAAAAFVGRIGLEVPSSSIALANGGQQGVFSALMALSRPGDALVVEALTYQPVMAMALHLGLRLVPAAMDGEGVLPDAFEAAVRRSGARLAYLMPTLHTPTTATLGLDRRREIAAIAERREVTIIEDDVFGFLPRERPVPIAALASSRTVFVTSVSKSMAPGLRVGYVAAPGPLLSPIEAAIAVSSWMPPPLMAEIARRWIVDGTGARLNAAQQAHAARRQVLARRSLGNRAYAADPQGLHLWLPLPPEWPVSSFVAAAHEAGVRVNAGDLFAVGADKPSAVRLCLSHEMDDRRVEEGLTVIASLLAGGGRIVP
ncbi:DNA-binding transcriptional regulator, MocR family, contains an aminotransferase domain [Pleomorphomonas diazotrophica]|nr:DNA-binding transcriptional regulator, MocR family, contains an aminotransferase domain [Pleomorphomonas diazotrophica]